jgi:hypothetical protein
MLPVTGPPVRRRTGRRERAHDDEQEDGHGRRLAQFAVAEGGLVDVADQHLRLSFGPPLVIRCDWPNTWKCRMICRTTTSVIVRVRFGSVMYQKALTPRGIVELRRRLVDVLRDVLQPGQEQDHGDAERPPDCRDDDRRHGELLIGEPDDRRAAESLRDVGDQALRGENMICQISVTTVTDSTWLRKKKRAQDRLCARLAGSSAAASRSAVIVTPGTVQATNRIVLPTVGQKRRSYQRPSSPG